jgi:proteic killer suppression protein
MIKTFKSKALRLLWEKNDKSKFPALQLKKIGFILQLIDDLEDVTEDLKNVTGNYRIIFRFENKNAFDIDYLDTH